MQDTDNSDPLDDAAMERGRSPWADARRRFLANRAAMAGVFGLLAISLFAIFAPLVSPNDMETMDFLLLSGPPTLEGGHWFGTDALGRDLLVRAAHGARISLMVGLVTSMVALSIGVVYGAVAGYLGGRVDSLMMRFVDVLYALPLVFFIIILATVFGRNIMVIFLAIGAVEWLTMSRIVRAQAMSLKQKEFVEAARAMGVSTPAIIRGHIVPNAIGPVVVFVTLLVPANILVESFMSFLGLGVQEPLTSWGVLIKQGADQLETAPWLLIFPATLLAATIFCFNHIGDGLRDALDPKER